VHDRPSFDMYSMAPPGPGGGAASGAAGGGAAGGGAVGSPPMGRYGILRVVSGNDQGKQIELNRTVTTIGRGADQMLVVADIAVSRRHLQILLQPNGYMVKDLGSPNGTMVNGKRVSEGMLYDGDQIEVGNSLLRFEHPPSRPQQEAPPAPPPPQPMMAPPPMMPQQPPAYPPQPMMPQQPMGYPQQPPGYPQSGYPQQPQPMMAPPPLAMPQPAFPSMVPPLATGTPAAVSAAQAPIEPSLYGGSMIAQQPAGPLGFLGVPKKRTLYLGVLGGAFAIGLIGLITTSAVRSGGGAKAVEKAVDLYTTGTKNFTASRYDEARAAFEQALSMAPDSETLKQYIEACKTEEKVGKIFEAAKGALEKRDYKKALNEFDRVPKDSTQYEDAQQQARMARREAVKTLLSEANSLAKSDPTQALAKTNEGLELDGENADLQELKNRLSNAPKQATPAEETQTAEAAPPPEKPEKAETKKPEKAETKKPEKTEKADKGDSGGAGDLASNKAALAAYQKKDFGGAISAMKSSKGPKAAQTIKDLEEVKAQVDKAGKLEGSNPSGAASAYQAAAAADKRLGGALASFLGGKASSLSKGGGTGSKPATPSGPAPAADPAKDGQADQLLAQARSMMAKNPTQAKVNCRKVMQLYGNNPKNPKVQEAFKLYNSIKTKDDDDDF
jgi:hypothetical protein